MPNCIPGSPQCWKIFGLDLIAMTLTRVLPDFVTLSVNDARPHVQATIRDGWGAAEKVEMSIWLSLTLIDTMQENTQNLVS